MNNKLFACVKDNMDTIKNIRSRSVFNIGAIITI